MNTTPNHATPAQLDIMGRLAQGECIGEVAFARGVSRRTVELQLQNLRERFGARNCYHLVAMYCRGEITG